MREPTSGDRMSVVEQDENENGGAGKDAISADSDAIEQAGEIPAEVPADSTKELPVAEPGTSPNPPDRTPTALYAEQAEKDARAAEADADADSAPDPAADEPIPPQTIDILAPFGDHQVSVIMYDENDRIRRVARTSQGTTLRFVLNENERLFISVADPTQHDKYLAMRDEDAAARG